jgi:predicted DCC family thiol-disulfide oxidoreductase YuxK
MEPKTSNPIVLYDGVCALCNRLVQFTLRHDSQDRFRFASLQSDFAARVLNRHGVAPQSLDTFYLVLDYGEPSERLEARSDAVVFLMQEMGDVWKIPGGLFRLLPRRLRDWGYNLIARNRYHIFGKYDACMLPEEKYRHKFLDQ